MTRKPPNILLIVLDAVRSDHISSYDYKRLTTPHIDKIAKNGIRFENAFANSNWTGTSHGAMFTGMMPSQSGIYAGNQQLPENIKLLPEYLKEQRYTTFGMSAGAHIRRDRGYDRGFDTYKETYRISLDKEFIKKAASDISLARQTYFSATKGPDKKTLYKMNSLKQWISGTEPPFFGFVNLKTAHNPYNPPRPFKSKYCPELTRPRFQFIEEFFGDEYGDYQSLSDGDIERLQKLSNEFAFLGGEVDPTPEEWDTLKSWYDGAINYMDSRIGELVVFLEDQNQLEETYIIVTADHGELFGEHGLEKHLYSLYEPVLRVPLVIRTPEKHGTTVDSPVSLLDLYPTVLDIADVSVSRDHATSLLQFENGFDRDYLFAELGEVSADGILRTYPDFDESGYGEPMQVVRSEKYKLIAHANGETELYDWRNDFAEETDLSESKPETVSELQSVLEDELSPLTNESLSEDIEDEELKEHLQDLGYM